MMEPNYTALVNELIDFIQDPSSQSFFEGILKACAYEGFDAAKARVEILKKVITRAEIPEKESAGLIMECIRNGLKLGNNIQKILSSTTGPGQARFRRAVAVLNIKSSAQRQPRTLTLSRIIACFPEPAVHYLHATEASRVIPHSRINGIHPEYPKVARHIVCAAIIPDKMPKPELMVAFDVILVSCMMLSEIINKKQEDWRFMTKIEKAESCVKHLENSFKSKVLDSSKREQLSIKYGIMEGDGLSSVWKTVGEHARRWLEVNYDYSNQNIA